MIEVFISHSRADKPVVDALVDFLLRCGLPAGNIFCSSLSGNGVRREISNEVKQAIKNSKLNIALLSDTYYKSPYCHNEAGILWYLEVPVVVVALPEITHTNMQGFLNNENYVRRLDNKDDIFAMADILRDTCATFNCNVAKMTDNVEKLMKEYQIVLQSRVQLGKCDDCVQQDDVTELEKRILANDFSDGELLYLKYFYDTDSRELLNDMLDINDWFLRQPFSVVMGDVPLTSLKEEKIIEEIFCQDSKSCVGYRLTLPVYRLLRKLSSRCLEYIDERLNQYKTETKDMPEDWNAMDWYVHNKLSEGEKLLMQYILVGKHKSIGTGWRTSVEIENIKLWEENMLIDNYLSEHYGEIVDEINSRNWLEVSEITQYGNPKEYKFTTTAETMIFGVCEETREALRENMRKHSVAPF